MRRCLLIGLDGADPALARRWIDEGALPHLAALARGGAFLPCASVRPPVTYPAWTTCVTGVNPGQHGIFDFTEVTPGNYALRFVNAADRRAPALWEIVQAAGGRSLVLGVPGTYPAAPLDGVMVAGFDSPVATRVSRAGVYPRAKYRQAAGWRYADIDESNLGPGWHARALAALHHGIDEKTAITTRLMREEAWDFAMPVFGEADTASHHFWVFHDPASPRHQPGMEHALRDIYAHLDQAVGELVAAAGADTAVGVVSDHGFGGAGTGVLHLNNWLAEHGHLHFAERVSDRAPLAKRLALAAVPSRWRGTLFRLFNGLAARAESASRFGGIDWAHTCAWSEELNYFPSVRINLRGREPQGQVAPEDYDDYVRALCAELEAWGPVARAWPRAAVYAGPHVDHAPDIILELAEEDSYSYNVLRARGGPSQRRLRPEEYLGGKERGMNGTHRPMGLFLWSAPLDVAACSLADIAPTVLAAMGVPAPPMEGCPLAGALAEAATDIGLGAARPLTATEAEQVAARLRALGYYE